VINHIILKDPQQVLLEVKVVQVDKSKLKEFGLSAVAKGRDAEGFTNLIGAPSGEVDTENFIGRGISTHGEGIMGLLPGVGGFTPLDPYQIGVSYFPSGIGFVLKALSTKGLAKILAEPPDCQCGKAYVGTRFPVQTVTGTGEIPRYRVRRDRHQLNFALRCLKQVL
jgi:pilus assembly protein CpaC